jgi:hypothetical protein
MMFAKNILFQTEVDFISIPRSLKTLEIDVNHTAYYLAHMWMITKLCHASQCGDECFYLFQNSKVRSIIHVSSFNFYQGMLILLNMVKIY